MRAATAASRTIVHSSERRPPSDRHRLRHRGKRSRNTPLVFLKTEPGAARGREMRDWTTRARCIATGTSYSLDRAPAHEAPASSQAIRSPPIARENVQEQCFPCSGLRRGNGNTPRRHRLAHRAGQERLSTSIWVEMNPENSPCAGNSHLAAAGKIIMAVAASRGANHGVAANDFAASFSNGRPMGSPEARILWKR